MSSIVIKGLEEAGKEGQYYAATCSHVKESDEIDVCAKKRLAWFKEMHENGLRILVGFIDGEPAGFLNMVPIEHSTWGPIGKDLMVLLCIFVPEKWKGKGLGKALLEASEEETKKQGKRALVTYGYHGDFWFMPASFFEKHGFSVIEQKKVESEGKKEFLEEEALLWKVFNETAERPFFLKRNYEFKPIEGKVVVDLFWDISCGTYITEAERVRDVTREFDDRVVLNEYPATNREVFLRHQIPRAIFVNGREIGWGYEAPKDGIRKAIQEALENL